MFKVSAGLFDEDADVILLLACILNGLIVNYTNYILIPTAKSEDG